LFLFHRTTTFYRKETFLATSPLMLSTHSRRQKAEGVNP